MASQSGALSFDVVLAVDAVTGIAVENAHTLVLAAELVNFAVCLEQARAEQQHARHGEYGRGSGLHGALVVAYPPPVVNADVYPAQS